MKRLTSGIIDEAGHGVGAAGGCEEGSIAQGRADGEQLNEGKSSRCTLLCLCGVTDVKRNVWVVEESAARPGGDSSVEHLSHHPPASTSTAPPQPKRTRG